MVATIADIRALTGVYENGLVFHCVCAIARLGVPDRLVGAPLPVSTLAADVGAEETLLFRVLRLLADHSIVAFEGNRVALTDRGLLLRRGDPLSLWATFSRVGPADLGHALAETLRTGRAAAQHVFGMSFWDYLACHPGQQAIFDEQMRQQAQYTSVPCVAAMDWPSTGRIADIGGGVGTLLAAVLQAAPAAHGILVDRPHVLDRALPFLQSQKVADRCQLHPGDLFAPAPKADVYLLSRVLHCFGDDDALQILDVLARSAIDGSRLRVFEALIPEDGSPHPSKMSDISMMLLFGTGRERSASEIRCLLESAGWKYERLIPGVGMTSVVEASRL